MRFVIGVLLGVTAFAQDPQFTKDNALLKPENYREWIYLSSGVGMVYGPARESSASDNPPFENVFVNPKAYKAFLESGKWPNGTTFVLEIRASASQGSINKGGHFQQDRLRYEVEVKDPRFPDNWAFFGFGEKDASAQAIPKTAGCQACHSKNGAVENTFVQFYPTLLPVAKAKGTLKPLPE
jgi:hypothetical protein